MTSWRRTLWCSIAVLSALLAACGERVSPGDGGLIDAAPPPTPDTGAVVPDAQQAPDLLLDATAPTPDQGPPTPCTVCTDPARCCKPEDIICVGDPDKGVVCSCDALWDCDADQTHCSQPAPWPGNGSWSCGLSGASYSCVGRGAVDDPSKWSCTSAPASQELTCVLAWVPNPCNTEAGASQWACSVSMSPAPRVECAR